MTKKLDSNIRVCHFVGLSGVGGVQRNFSEYMKLEVINGNKYKHTIYTIGEVDDQYQLSTSVLNILKFRNLMHLISDLISKAKIVHFYNNLTSFKVAIFLFFLPAKKLIVHERGSAWNLPSKYGFILRFIAWKADLILANSKATKILLEKKFDIQGSKIKVIYNGVNTLTDCNHREKPLQKKGNEKTFIVGFIGRLDTPKGVHILIDAMHYLKNEDLKLIIAGDGPLRQDLVTRVKNLKSVQFVGRVVDTHKFFNKIDLLVVPSIREPFGNVCIEAGLWKVPVLASYIDGIPEIIENYTSGELIKPTYPVSYLGRGNSLPLPEYVVDPVNYKLIKPMQISPSDLSDKILLLSNSPKILEKYTNTLYKNVVNNFSIEHYTVTLNNIYLELMGAK